MPAPARKAANLAIRADLLAEARAHKINLSRTLEAALEAELRRHREAAWIAENEEAVAAYGRHVEKHGLFADKMRSF
ncbi:MAG: type II toxin-antitoxin system CcdA family antitoxin [Rhodocyclaceae bacterium]|nr:type II toxin-antitoxin system CcdA family antitoxin [Rhodocyclaceae bacterium]